LTFSFITDIEPYMKLKSCENAIRDTFFDDVEKKYLFLIL